MRAKDMKVGMEVALVASSWFPYEEPERYVVVSLDHRAEKDSGWGYSSQRDKTIPVALPKNVLNDGKKTIVQAPIREIKEGERRDVAVLAKVNKEGEPEIEVHPLRKIEGPYAEVQADRIALRRDTLRAQEARREGEAKRQQRRSRLTDELVEVLDDKYFRGGFESNSISLTLDQVETLLGLVRGRPVPSPPPEGELR